MAKKKANSNRPKIKATQNTASQTIVLSTQSSEALGFLLNQAYQRLMTAQMNIQEINKELSKRQAIIEKEKKQKGK